MDRMERADRTGRTDRTDRTGRTDRTDRTDFHDMAHRLVGQEVEVITTQGTFTGTLLSVGSNFIIMRTRIRGRLVRLLIRLALIVALFRLTGIRRSFGFASFNPVESEEDTYVVEDDEFEL
ncbi:hypothetical protein ACFOU2_01950 [Bacillus songklensis]|uniref:DUF2642 domain-containing protein n=1 Tax=Bacillus songklensis TaxID=1069116 RepID=A0ABV8AXI2_9BACI